MSDAEANQPFECKACGTMCAYETETCPGCGEPVAPPLPDDMVGTLLAEKYAIERKLGEGGMGMVYLATQEPIGRQVCLKVVHQDICNDPVSFRRFQREAEMASKVMHQGYQVFLATNGY